MKNHLSEEILEILNESPRWLVRMGATVIAFLLLLLLTGSWYIRYPEVLKGTAVVTTTAPTIKVVNEGDGRLMRLLVANGATVKKGDVLAEMENSTRLENTAVLQQLLTQTQIFLQNNQGNIELPPASLTWGDVQADVQALTQQYLDFKRQQTDVFYPQQLAILKSQIHSLRQLQQVFKRKKDLNTAAFDNTAASFVTDQKLFAEGLFSRTELLRKENEYLDKRKEQEDYAENMIQNDLKLAELEQQLKTIEFNYREKQHLLLTAIRASARNIENGLRHWQQQYLLTAPSDGKLTYLKNLTENQHISAGETLFAVMPHQQDFVAMVEIPVKGMGKARVGQKVVLKLDDFPFQEFGTVTGNVVNLSPSADVKSYRVVVQLPNGLQSSFHQTFLCTAEMAGTAEIITDDMRLFERAFYGIRKLVM